jgi:transcriptional regulator with XRE-family HTH domain
VEKVRQGDTPLRRWRIAHGKTQVDIATDLGIEQKVYSRYELDERVPYKHLEAIHQRTRLPYKALLHPREFLEEHPDFLRQGVRPLNGRGRPYKIAVAQ